jgi:hypothetical protein
MHDSRRGRDSQCLAQESCFFGVALDQVDHGARGLRECAGEHNAGETAAAAEVDPDLCGRRPCQKLKRVGDMAGPEVGQGRRRDEIGLGLPLPEEVEVAIEARLCFT